LTAYRLNLAAVAFSLQFVLGLLLVFGTPPLSAPDEIYHWPRALQISEGRLLPRRAPDGEWGGKIDRAAFDYRSWVLNKLTAAQPIAFHDAWDEAKDLESVAGEKVVRSFPTTASFSPVAYLPQAAGIAVAHAFDANIVGEIFAGRIANLVAFFCLTGLACRLLPAGRYIFLVAMFMPTALHLAASLSADAMNLAIPALLIALCLRLRADADFALTASRKWSIAGLVVACGLLKEISIVCGLAVLLIPSARFIDARRRWLFVLSWLGAGISAAAIWNLSYPFVPGIFWHYGADPAATIRLILADPGQALAVLANTLDIWWRAWYRGYIAQIGGTAGFVYFLPASLVWPTALILAALAVIDGAKRRDLGQAVLLLAIAVLFLAALLAAFMLGFSRPGAPMIEGIQGRYLFVFYLAVALALGSLRLTGREHPRPRAALFLAATGLEAFLVLSALRWFQTVWIY
jgi:uncharacterized membrane protein